MMAATDKPERISWSRRLSSPGNPSLLPTLPTITGLRAALLGYLGELETSLRERERDFKSPTPDSPSFSSEATASSSCVAAPSSAPGLRQRLVAVQDPEPILSDLTRLRADVLSYVHTNFGHREWLGTLPARLSAVDLGLGASVSASALDARKRVLELVHDLLPPDDWAGWERLGWEEQDHSEAGDDEPEYLFPNRTPASAEAVQQTRRWLVRSKSVGAASAPRAADTDGWAGEPLQRVRTNPSHAHARGMSVDSALDYDAADAFLGDAEHVAEVLALKGPSIEQALERSANGARLVTYDDLPFWWRNNQYIFTGYRFIPLHGKTGPIPLLKSAFAMHNETVNIHSHFVPSIALLCCIPLIAYSSPLPDAHWLDTTMLCLYLTAAISCLLSSASWHVLSGCASRGWFEWGACVDYVGISWLIAMSFNTVVYNVYYCHPRTVLGYTATNIACGALGSYLPFQRWFNERKNKNWRIAFFLFLNFAMIAPMVQLFYQQGYDRGSAFLSPFGRSIYAYLVGLVLYAFHWPECFWPGKFDRWGASHQLWHWAIVIAIYLHYKAIFVAHDARLVYSCAAPDAGEPVTRIVDALLGRW
ncbi:inc metabolism membrane protein [Cryptotrichosporon argae]